MSLQNNERAYVERMPEQDVMWHELASALKVAAHDGSAEQFDSDTLREILGAALKIYADKFEAGERGALVGPDSGLSATSTLVIASMLLKGENLALFELGMFQTFSGIQ